MQDNVKLSIEEQAEIAAQWEAMNKKKRATLAAKREKKVGQISRKNKRFVENAIRKKTIFQSEETLLKLYEKMFYIKFLTEACDKDDIIKRAKRIERKAKDPYYNLKARIKCFQKKGPNTGVFTYLDVVTKFGESPICYLTGLPIDYINGSTFEFDHIIPVSKGGTSDLDNLGLTIPEANQMKFNYSIVELSRLCKLIAERHA